MLNAWLVNRHTLERTVMCVCCVALFFRSQTFDLSGCLSQRTIRENRTILRFVLIRRQPAAELPEK